MLKVLADLTPRTNLTNPALVKTIHFYKYQREAQLLMTYGILSNQFRLQVYNGWYAWSDSTGRVYEHIQTLYTQAWPLSVTDQSSVVH